MPRILHVISGLGLGGAEGMLCRLLGAMDRCRFPSAVASLTCGGARKAELEGLGVPVHELGLNGPWLLAKALWRLIRVVRTFRPDVIQCWMYHADLLGGLVGRALGIPVVWGLRQSDLDPRHSRLHTRQVVRACARLSRRIPERVVSCSERAADVHRRLGYRAPIVVIPNGVSLTWWRRDPQGGAALRQELGIPEGAAVIGMAARWHPQKDHATLVAAAVRLPGTHWLLCGEGITRQNEALLQLVHPVRERVHLLGPLRDLRPFYSALDVHVLSAAFGEGFPNVVAEAMACEVPCVVTDVGDAPRLVGDAGHIVPPRDPEALAGAVSALLGLNPDSRRSLGAKVRRHIAACYDIDGVARRYEALYCEVATWHG